MAEEPIVDHDDDDDEMPMSPARKAAASVVVAVAVMGLLVVLSHVSAPRILPDSPVRPAPGW